MSLYLSYIILYKNFFEKSKRRKNPVLDSSQTYSVRAKIHCLAAHYQPLSRSLVTVLPTKMSLESLTIGYHIVQYGIFHLKSIFSLFIALLRHWGPHATSINNKIFRNLINHTQLASLQSIIATQYHLLISQQGRSDLIFVFGNPTQFILRELYNKPVSIFTGQTVDHTENTSFLNPLLQFGF